MKNKTLKKISSAILAGTMLLSCFGCSSSETKLKISADDAEDYAEDIGADYVMIRRDDYADENDFIDAMSEHYPVGMPYYPYSYQLDESIFYFADDQKTVLVIAYSFREGRDSFTSYSSYEEWDNYLSELYDEYDDDAEYKTFEEYEINYSLFEREIERDIGPDFVEYVGVYAQERDLLIIWAFGDEKTVEDNLEEVCDDLDLPSPTDL